MRALDFAGLDLSRIIKGDHGRRPELGFVLVSHKADRTAVAAALASAGAADLTVITETEDGVVFSSEKIAKSDRKFLLVKVDDTTVMGVAHATPEKVLKYFSSYSYESTDFREVMSQNQAMPMVSLCQQALGDVMYNILCKADAPSDAADQITAAINDFENAVLGVIKNIPVVAFKVDAALRSIEAPAGEAPEAVEDAADETAPITKAEDEPDADAADEGAADEPAADAGTEEPAEAAADEDAGEDAASEDEASDDPSLKVEPKAKAKAKAVTEEENAAGVPNGNVRNKDKTMKGDEPSLAEVMAAIQSIGGQVASLKTDVDGIASGQTTLTATVKQHGDAIRKFDDDLGGGLLGGDTPDDRITKSDEDDDDDGDAGFLQIDTAYGNPFAAD